LAYAAVLVNGCSQRIQVLIADWQMACGNRKASRMA